MTKYNSSLRYFCQNISNSYIFDQRTFDKICWKVIYLTKYIGNYIFDLLTVHCRFSRESGPGARTLPKIQSSKKNSLKHKGKYKYKYKTCILQNPANPAHLLVLTPSRGTTCKEVEMIFSISYILTFVFFVRVAGTSC